MRNVFILFSLAGLLLIGAFTLPAVHAAPDIETAALAVIAAPNTQGCSGTPTIQYAYANPPVINAGQVTTLYWGLVGNANAAYLQHPNGHREGIGTPGTRQVNPTQTSTWYVVGVCGNAEAQIPITVTVNNTPGCNGTPQMNGFTASPQTIRAGQTSSLSWGPVNNAQYVQLSSQNQGGSGVPAPGSINVTPNQTTTYYLTAWCQSNTAQLQVTVNVSNPPPTPPPASGNAITGIAKNGGLSNAGQLVVTVNYFWNGQDAPATIQVTAYNGAGQPIGQSNATRIDPNRSFHANVTMKPYPGGLASVTACMRGSSGTELVCQSAPMQ